MPFRQGVALSGRRLVLFGAAARQNRPKRRRRAAGCLPPVIGIGRERAKSINEIPQEPTMALERTFSIIKPDATRRNLTGNIIAKFEEGGLRIIASRRIQMTRTQAEGFYAVHKARPFFGELVDFMISGPVVIQVLQGENAIARNRDIMGATDPKKAAPGTIRAEFAESIGENSVHGSDAPETAAQEIAYFFAQSDIVP